jgi:hypothetical protein
VRVEQIKCDMCGTLIPVSSGVDAGANAFTLRILSPGRNRDSKDFCCADCLEKWLRHTGLLSRKGAA